MPETTAVNPVPRFSASALTLLVTGSVNAALVPHWLTWLRHLYPSLSTSVVVTRSAEKFVTVEALRALATGNVWRDSWDEDFPCGSHLGLESTAQAFAIFPATLDSVMRLAGGRSDSPMMMALQCTEKPISIASAFPGTNPLVQQQIERLHVRPNVAFVDMVPAYRLSHGDWGGRTGFFLPAVLETLEQMLGSWQSAQETTPEDAPLANEQE